MKATYKLQLKQLLASTVLLTMLAGCGQSGPLYLPDESPTTNKALPAENSDHTQQQPTPMQQQEQ